MTKKRNRQQFRTSALPRTKYVLLTGASGLLGQYLIKDLFERQQRVAVIVRANKRMSAQQRVEAIMRRWERQLQKRLPRPVVLVGDVTNDRLNLSESDISWVGENCDRMIHSAAVLQFHGSTRASEPWQTNLDGTRNVIGFATRTGIAEFHYISTAYVSGLSDDPVSETDFDRGQEFRNDYERSKFEAEQLVRTADGFSATTVYRPAVIVGDSETGFTSTYHGLFLYLRFAATLVPEQQPDSEGIRQTPLSLPFSGDEPRNLVPVDWVSRVISEIFCNPEAHNRTFHLVPDHFATFRQIIGYCCEYFNSTGVEYGQYQREQNGDSAFAAKFFENVRVYQAYETSDPVFDDSNVKAFCGDFKCPEIDRAMIYRFLDFGIKDKWGKKKPSVPDATPWINRYRPAIDSALQSLCDSLEIIQPIQFGIDVAGVGGGQWRFTVERDGETFCQPGLPADQNLILALDCNPSDAAAGQSTFDTIADWIQRLEPIIRRQRLDDANLLLNR